jgi:DNA-binding transcriptional MocR family regulator
MALEPMHATEAAPSADAAHPLMQRLACLRRDDPVSLTQQLLDAFTAAIASGELAPGAKLPPTRQLALLAGVNQLTASRCYRRLQEMGAVISHVGRGTFVRAAASGHQERGVDDANWQAYVLPAERRDESHGVLSELARQVDARDVITLSCGFPSADMIPLAQLSTITAGVLAREGARAFDFGPVEGIAEYRAAIAAHGARHGLEDGANAIVATTGARQALTLAARALLRPGDKVACESPTFMGIIGALRSAGAEVLPIPVDEQGLDTGALEQLLRGHEIRLVATQPRLQNPTGRDLAPARRARLIELAQAHSFFILEDAVYADLRYEGEDLGPLRPAAPAHVVYVNSLSKTVGAGLRAGWIVASGPALDRIVAEKASDDSHGATLPQLVSAEFLGTGLYESQLARVRTVYRERRDALHEALDREMGELADYAVPPGGHHFWVTLREPLDDQLLYRSALAAGVTFTPGAAMLVERPRATQMRLSFGFLDPDQLREGVRRLATVVRSLSAGGAERHSSPIT